MALPSEIEIKGYLRVSTDVEDTLFATLRMSAMALVTQYLRVPLEGELRTFQGRYPRAGLRREAAEQLTIPVIPCSTAITVTDLDEAVVDNTTYAVDARRGHVNADRFIAFDNPPYTIDVSVGWIHDPNYDGAVEPILRQAILDIAADMYKRRNPGAVYEQSGGQVSVTYTESDIPARTKLLLDSLRPRGNPF